MIGASDKTVLVCHYFADKVTIFVSISMYEMYKCLICIMLI